MAKLSVQEKVKQVTRLLDSTEGKFFYVEFLKKDGSKRVGTFRTGVAAYTTGEGLKFDAKSKNLRPLWEAGNKDGAKKDEAYRMLSLDTVQLLRINGQEYKF